MKNYKIIYADPPYSYRNKNTGGSMKSGSSAKYPTMTINELCTLNIPSGKNNALFLWATVPLLPEALFLMDHWGFKYKTTLFWRKMSLGLGFWFRGQVEMLLLGIKGKVKAFRIQKPNIIQVKVGRHSEKPEEFRKLIEMTGLKPRIELFARKKTRGWDVWGNEVASDVIL